MLRIEWPGGGGWGEPLLRDPERVLADVTAGKVSRRRARETYGVVLDTVGRNVDRVRTEQVRARLMRTRKRMKARGGKPSKRAVRVSSETATTWVRGSLRVGGQ
jgi:N-methylhydantoinase B